MLLSSREETTYDSWSSKLGLDLCRVILKGPLVYASGPFLFLNIECDGGLEITCARGTRTSDHWIPDVENDVLVRRVQLVITQTTHLAPSSLHKKDRQVQYIQQDSKAIPAA